MIILPAPAEGACPDVHGPSPTKPLYGFAWLVAWFQFTNEVFFDMR
jgi:hypothetical protein